MDPAAHLRRFSTLLRPHRPTLIAFAVAASSFVVAGIYLGSPDLGQTTGAASLPRLVARGFVIALGPATLLLALLAGFHAVLHLWGRGMAFTPMRTTAAAALFVFLPCLFALVGARGGAAGGVVGLLARDAVLVFFPPLFAVPLLVGLTLLSLVFATDWLFYGRLRSAGLALAPPRPAPAVVPEEEYAEEEDPDDEEEPEDEEAEADEWEEDEEEEEEYEEEEPEAPIPLPRPVPVAAPPRPRARQGRRKLPGSELLEQPEPIDLGRVERTIQTNSRLLEKTLAAFRIETRVVGYTRGPVITMYELALKEGIKLSQVVGRADDLAIALKAESVRIVAPIPGKNTVGVEVPNIVRDDVRLRSLLEECGTMASRLAIPIFLGRDAAGNPMVDDLTMMPHLLLAGATGSGKSVCINSIIVSILMTRRREDVRLILVDPKQVELAFFRDIPHLLTEVVTDPRKAAQTLEWVITEMEDRYRIFALFGVRNIAAYNRLGAKRVRELAKLHDIGEASAPDHMPYLVVVVDELADLIMTGRKEVEYGITRLAQKSRAVGIHSVLATQRPSTDVITGLIKANMPSRVSFKVTSKVDSRVVLDQSGAEKLLGRGDMLFLPPRAFHLVRAQGCYATDQEVRAVVAFLRQHGPGQELRELVVRPETLDERDPREVDSLFDPACRIVLESQRGSASLLQRALQIGYTRASRLVDLMRSQGIIGEFKNAQAADVLVTLEEYEEKFQTSPEP
ncbi:MAG: DNA translocase FtsK [Planctomycetota bacterium]|jgi:S-DNA-T family DNA segregation ATPase FtsK/SpoIIIE